MDFPTVDNAKVVASLVAAGATVCTGIWTVFVWVDGRRKRDRTSVDAVVGALLAQHEATARRYDEVGDVRAAVSALKPGGLFTSTDERTSAALIAAARGEVEVAEALFAQEAASLEAQAQQSLRATNRRAALAYRYQGALAALHDTKKAESAYRKATELDGENAEGWDQLARLLTRLGHNDEALDIYRKPLEAASERDRQVWRATSLNAIGAIHRRRSQWEAAEKYAREALQLSEQLGFDEGIAAASSNLGNITKNQGLLDQAESFHRHALSLHTRLGSQAGMANDHGNLGNVYKDRKKFGLAEKQFKNSLALEKALGRKEGMAADLGNLGQVYKLRGKPKKAREYFDKALTLNRELLRKEGMAIQLFNLAEVDELMGDLTTAVVEFERSRDLFNEIGNVERAREAEGRREAIMRRSKSTEAA